MTDLGKTLLILGGLLVLTGALVMLAGRVPLLGRLPGDLSFQKGHVSFYFPLVTCLLLSAVLTLLLNLGGRLFG